MHLSSCGELELVGLEKNAGLPAWEDISLCAVTVDDRPCTLDGAKFVGRLYWAPE